MLGSSGTSGQEPLNERQPALLTLLLLPGFVTDRRSQVDLAALPGGAVPAAQHHAQAGLLEDARVVVVGVAHGPAAQMPLRAPVLCAVDELLVGIRPFLEPVSLFHILTETRRVLLCFKLQDTTVHHCGANRHEGRFGTQGLGERPTWVQFR